MHAPFFYDNIVNSNISFAAITERENNILYIIV